MSTYGQLNMIILLIVAVLIREDMAAQLYLLNQTKLTINWCLDSNYPLVLQCYQQGFSHDKDVQPPIFLVQNSSSIFEIPNSQGLKYKVIKGPLDEIVLIDDSKPYRMFYLIMNGITADDDGNVFTCTDADALNVSANLRQVFDAKNSITLRVYEDCSPENKLPPTAPSNTYSTPSISASSSLASTTSSETAAAKSPATTTDPSSVGDITVNLEDSPETYKGESETNNVVTGVLAFFLFIAFVVIMILVYILYRARTRTTHSLDVENQIDTNMTQIMPHVVPTSDD